MVDERRAGLVRLDPEVRKRVDEYASDNGISYNAAMNILVRRGLRAETNHEKGAESVGHADSDHS